MTLTAGNGVDCLLWAVTRFHSLARPPGMRNARYGGRETKEAPVKNHALLIAFLSLTLVATSCQQPARQVTVGASGTDAAADVAAIKATLAEWMRLYNASEFEALVSTFYADDAVLMSPDRPPHIGTEAILRTYTTSAESSDEHCDRSMVEDVRVSGELAVARGTDTGTTTPKGGGKPAEYSIKWLVAFERQPDRTWKCVVEMWNENRLP